MLVVGDQRAKIMNFEFFLRLGWKWNSSLDDSDIVGQAVKELANEFATSTDKAVNFWYLYLILNSEGEEAELEK